MSGNPLHLDRLPPHSVELEQGLLGCVLLSPVDCLNQLAERKAVAGWFYDLRHQHIFHAARALHDAQKSVDVLTVAEFLRERELFEQIGGYPYLNELQDRTPSAANLTYYADVVREKFQMRRVLQACTETVAKIYDHDGSVDTLLNQITYDFDQLQEEHTAANEKPMRTIIQEVIADMEDHHYTRGSTQLRGLPTGPAGNYLDKLLRGIREDFYVVLAGRPGDGKTSLALNIVEHLALDYEWRQPTGQKDAEGNVLTEAHKGIPIGIFSLEMSDQSLGYRMLFGRGGVDTGEYYSGYARAEDDEHAPKLVHASGQLAGAEIYIDDASGQSIAQIAAKARRWAKQYGIKLFVLDFLQLLEGDNARDDDRVRLAKISKKIVALKKQLKIPWLVLAQMNRNIETTESKRVPVLSDLKDCGAIEQDADVVVFLYKPDRNTLKFRPKQSDGTEGESDDDILNRVCADWDWSKRPARVNAFVAKHRYGPTGKAEMLFAKNLCRFLDWHLWKVKHGAEERKAGERQAVVGGPKQTTLIDSEDVP